MEFQESIYTRRMIVREILVQKGETHSRIGNLEKQEKLSSIKLMIGLMMMVTTIWGIGSKLLQRQ